MPFQIIWYNIMIRSLWRNSARPYRVFRQIGTGPDPSKDYYKEMGLSPGATPAEVKKQYVKLVKMYHPDQNKGINGLTRLRNR